MNPIAQKILDAGGTILNEPLLNEDGSINDNCKDELFRELDREPISHRINKVLHRKDKPK